MAIRLETSKRSGIDNVQGGEIAAFQSKWNARLPKQFPDARRRTEMSAIYNCHGLTFASRRTRVENTQGVQKILQDDHWLELTNPRDVLPGDVVVYFAEEGEANHSGTVIECDGPLFVPLVCSKWGNAGEFIHRVRYCPTIYGPVIKFYRCQL